MAKAVLVINLPKNCWECYLTDPWERCDAIKITANKYGMKIREYEHSRPSWCPLKPLPNRWIPQLNGLTIADQIRNIDFAGGWNACLQKIQGDNDEV